MKHKLTLILAIFLCIGNLSAQNIIKIDTLTSITDPACCASPSACCNEKCCDADYNGLVLSFYGADIPFREYNVAANGSSGYRVIAEERSDVEVGAAALFQYGLKFLPQKLCDAVGVHLSFGPAISFSPNPRPRLVTGMGLSFGKSAKLNLGFGLITGHMDVLSNGIDLNANYNVAPTELYSSQLVSRAYLSLGYRLCN